MDAAYSFAKNLINIKYDDLPAEVVEITKKQILDILGVMLGGSSKPGVSELVGLLADWGGKEESSVLSFGLKLPAPDAAQANATMGHALDFDDTGDGPTHPSVVIVPTCLALSEHAGKTSGREFITSVALGIDMMCRLGQAFRMGMRTAPAGGHPGAGWHLTTLYGFLASAGVAGRMMGLDEKRLVNAMGIAYHQCSGNGQCVNEGSLTKRMGPGFAVRGGVSSAFMAAKGITGAENCIEGEFGLYNLYHHGEYDAKSLTHDLGKYFSGLNVEMKPYPCCKGTHCYVDAALRLVNRYDIKPDDVRKITIYCRDENYFLLSPLEKRSHPQNPVDSQFSIPWAIASVIANRRASIGDFTDEAIKDRRILEMSGKINVVKDESLANIKDQDYAKIGIETKNGRTYMDQTDNSANSSRTSLPFSSYERKFRDCASYSIKTISENKINQIIDSVKELEHISDIREIIDLLR